MPNVAIEFKEVSKAFGNVRALDKLTFSIAEGSICAFLGPNGAGKSTALRILTSLVSPDSGSVHLFDRALDSNRANILSQIGALIERPAFYEHFTAFENLRLLNRYEKERLTSEEINAVLSQVGLLERKNSAVSSYSEGMKQRLGIAQAIMQKPKLLILDEPFSNLDPQGVKEIRDLVTDLNTSKGMTILVSSHNLDEVEKFATHLVLMDKGVAVVNGSIDDLIFRLNRQIRIDIGDSKKARLALESEGYTQILIESQTRLTLQVHSEQIPIIIDILRNQQLAIYEITIQNDLENLFLSTYNV